MIANRISIGNISPGPWRTVSTGKEAHWESVGIESSEGEAIATVKGIGSNEERSANARLICAAPALLDVLLELMEFWDNGTPVHAGALIVGEARAAIQSASS